MKRIMIVDDDVELRTHLIEILLDEGYAVDSAASAKEALEKGLTQVFDVILLDLMMPGTSGIDALQEITKRNPRSKVIMITAFASVESAVDAIKKGASNFISKPFKIPDLLMTIRRALEESKFDSEISSLNCDQAFNSFASPIRRNILKLLHAAGPMRRMEITRKLDIEDHTKIAFHLRILKEAGIVEQDDGKSYILTKDGKKTLNFLKAMDQLSRP